MTRTATQPLVSFCIAAVLTFGMLAGIDHLAQPDAAQPQMAHLSAHQG